MTTEEKAKAYDEVLERAKEQIKECGDNEGRKRMIRKIFPGLVESEDERIKKSLINELKINASLRYEICRCGWNPDKLVAWLEKQKDTSLETAMKEVTKDKESAVAFLKSAGILDESENLAEPYCTQNSDKCAGCNNVKGCVTCVNGDQWAHIEEQKLYEPHNWPADKDNLTQQKPAEWSKDYREEDLRVRFAFYTYKDEDDALYLSNVFVEEASRNRGLGAKILTAAEKVAPKRY